MRRFLLLTANTILGVLAGFGVTDAAGASELPQLFYVGMGLAGGCWAGAAACLASHAAIAPSGDVGPVAGLPKVVGLVGTLAVCAAALMGHLSPPELKTAAVGFWFLGLVTQALGLAMALSERRADIASKRPHKPARQKTRGA
jgi:dipeptide/tripeptide permease